MISEKNSLYKNKSQSDIDKKKSRKRELKMRIKTPSTTAFVKMTDYDKSIA